jgi:F-type H+-transporting ATPase subunit delta
MREESVARRYAAALFQQAKAKGTLDADSTDLSAVVKTLTETPKLLAVVGHPLIAESKKKDALKLAFDGKVRPSILAFLNLLVDKRRIELFADVKTEFDRLLREDRRIVAATAVTAVPMTPEQTAALEKSLEARTGFDVELTCEIDASLMGGVLVRIGDTVLDGSVRGSLERLREQLLARK